MKNGPSASICTRRESKPATTCELVPPLAIFGGCSDSHPHKSKLSASPLTLICKALADGPVSPSRAAEIAGVGHGTLDPDAPLPWEFIDSTYGRDTLQKAYEVMMSRLT
jgi:hypothetical protein